jgi:CheY-like chemotaxis protein
VEADANQLQQALVNLALNARDAILERRAGMRGVEPGGAGPAEAPAAPAAEAGAPEAAPGTPPPAGDKIVFRLRHAVLAEQPAFPQRVPPGDYLVLEVEDRGAGMPPEVLNQALDPFFTTKEVGRGTGLGLPTVLGIVQGHQGYLTIDSSPGRGTCVGLYLPRRSDGPEAAPPAAPHQGPATLEPESTPSRAILVIDDEEAVLDVVRRFLQIAGHRVTGVTSGAAALTALGRPANGRPVDLIVLDLMIPREDAAVTFRRLRQRCPGVPVLLCTGLPQADPAPELLCHGAVGLIRKPFRMNELWYAVKQALAAGAG